MNNFQDHELFQKIKKGDLGAYESLFKKYYSPVVKFAYSICRNLITAEEIAQEVFMYIWEKRSTLEIHTDIKSYLFTSGKNKCLNYIKHELPKQQALSDINDYSYIQSNISSIDDTEVLKKKIQIAIDQLPDKCRNIFVLSRYGGLTYNEISEDLNLSVKTVENQMSIALRKLRESLHDDLKNYRIK